MRTAASTFRGTCFDILKTLTANDVGIHFVRCIRTDLTDTPGGFHPEVVRQQLRALAVVSTILTTQQGYSYSVSHNEFIRRYKFLAFDFDENVEETRDNCRLLLLRLKLEGWTMGKTKVFLKYYNKEYLSRLYETQIKKIVKVQSMMRAFMARRKLYAKIKRYQVDADPNRPKKEEENDYNQEPATERKLSEDDDSDTASNLIEEDLDETQKAFIRPWFKRWRAKSLFQVLLLYRAERLQNLVNFCLQIHLYNQNSLSFILKTNNEINLEEINEEAEFDQFFPPDKPFIHKLPFVWESLILRGDVSNCHPLPECNLELLESEISAKLNKIKNSEEAMPENLITDSSMIFKADKEIQTNDNEKQLETPNKEENSQPNIQQNTEDFLKVENYSVPNDEEKDTKELLFNKEEPNLEQIIEAPEKNLDTNELNKFEVSQVDPNQNTDNHHHDIEDNAPPKPNEESSILTENPRNKDIRNDSSLDQQPKHKPKFKNSLQELEEKFKQTTNNENNEEPPFNFRTLLRKTENSSILIKDYKSQSDWDQFDFREYPKPNSYGNLKNYRRNSDTIVTEIAPGILIHGKISDL